MAEFYDDFKSIVLNKTPLLDVRAPVEFQSGAFVNACNLPIMNDEERRLVGICYKNEGNAKAIELGHKLVSGDVKEQRVREWCDFIDANPGALLYCFRGGQRSKISQQWIKESGREISRLKGGYKAFRNYLLRELEEVSSHFSPIVLGGRTGSGKTIVLQKMSNAVDLEALANHRGSSFGQKVTSQPSQINFDNNLAYELIAKREEGHKTFVFEDEGKHVGSVFMPESLVASMANAPLVILERPLEERIAITLDEYVIEAQRAYADAGFEEGWEQNIQNSIKRIQRRLGNQRYEYVNALFEEAFKKQKEDGLLEAHEGWIEYLLREYYDPMYDYQIQKREERVVFRGNEKEVLEYITRA